MEWIKKENKKSGRLSTKFKSEINNFLTKLAVSWQWARKMWLFIASTLCEHVEWLLHTYCIVMHAIELLRWTKKKHFFIFRGESWTTTKKNLYKKEIKKNIHGRRYLKGVRVSEGKGVSEWKREREKES